MEVKWSLLNISFSRFIRKGEVGGWKDELSAEHVARLDEMTNGKVTTVEQLNLFSEN
jgi:hypothetical protein